MSEETNARLDPELTTIIGEWLEASNEDHRKQWEANRELIFGDLNIRYQANETSFIGDSFLFWTPQQWEEYWECKDCECKSNV